VAEAWTRSTEGTNTLRIFEGKIARKICEPVKEGQREQTRRKECVTGGRYSKIYKFLRLRWCGHVERIGHQQMPKQIAASTIEGTRKRGRSRKRWTDEVEVNLSIVGIKNSQGLIRDLRERRKILLEATFYNGA